MSNAVTDFFGPGVQLPVPPRPAGGPAPIQGPPAVARPAPSLDKAPEVAERPAPADLDGDGTVSLDEMLTWVVNADASDLHLSADNAPAARLHGSLSPIDGTGTISALRLEAMLNEIMNPRQRAEFAASGDMDLAYALGRTARFRVNIFRQRGKIGSVMRTIPSRVRTVAEMGIPQQLQDLAMLPRGLVLVTGPTGSGKALSLTTRVPTPTGWSTMGQLAVGDSVLGRDGKPCTVTALSAVNPTPDLYRVTFSDGQTVEADADHQWLVSTHHDRSMPRTKKRVAAIARHAAAHRAADALDLLATTTGSFGVTVDELFSLLAPHDLGSEFESAYAVGSALHMTDCPSWDSTRDRRVDAVVQRNQPSRFFAVRDVLEALVTPKKGRHLGTRAKAQTVLDGTQFPAEAPIEDIQRLVGLGAGTVRSAVDAAGLPSRPGSYTGSYNIGQVRALRVVEFPADIALKSLALRLRQRFSHVPSAEGVMSRLTTLDMLRSGLRRGSGPADFAAPVPSALDLPEADLAVDPYLLGAWLGDGHTGEGRYTADPNTTDQALLVAHLDAAGYRPHSVKGSPYAVQTWGLKVDLRAAGVLLDKHVPVAYLRASAAQRLAVVQGLMDTDGSISKIGTCELCLSDPRLAADALTLIRSLGIKATMTTNRASYRDRDGIVVECKDRHRIKFTTDQPVFRLPRKLERLPQSVRVTSRWNYVVAIEPIESAPARCISVDSDDHAYLVGDGLVTSNSTLLAALIDHANRTRRCHIITLEDPIEFTHASQMSVVTQREVHEDTDSFASGLRAALREDPDIILVGEMRDLETTQAAIEAAETGHLVFGTMHTKSTHETVSRAVNMFPKEIQNQIQTTLASCLEAVVTQTLVKTIDGTGRTAAREVMMLDPAIRNLIRQGKLEQISSALQTGLERGMYTLNADLARLVLEKRISYEEAALAASDLTELDTKLGRAPGVRRRTTS